MEYIHPNEVSERYPNRRVVEAWLHEPNLSRPLLYCVGNLARARETNRDLHLTAFRLLREAEDGKVLLFQERVAPGMWNYLAHKKPLRWEW